ncbi:hypothetical protein ACPPVU_03875 [Mucilaginibacter sp. McL0603]|uniref:hypothetical protein n=1 Tax=Mucilaginibacter sp. McL0603 TaxID=3415670 RepID=UPI003CFA833D
MDILELSPDPEKVRKSNIVQFRTMEYKPVVSFSRRSKEAMADKAKTKWFAKYMLENLTVKEALIRGSLAMVIPVLSAIDWNCRTHTMLYIAPILFYFEVTVFTMTCPVKSLLRKYRQSSVNDLNNGSIY